jgi:glycosyltransferase involved in cell wall biosynthesis
MHGKSTSPAGTVAISANSAWNLLHFRRPIISRLVELGWRLVAVVPEDEFRADLERLGVEVRPLAMDPRGISPLADSVLFFRYYRLLRTLNPTVFMAFTAKPNIYGSAAAAWAGIPSINTVSGLGTGFLSGRALEAILTRLYRWSLRGSYRVFFHNADDRELFIQRKILQASQAAVVSGSGISLSDFSPVPSIRCTEAPTFLYIGRFLKDKGVREFLAAAEAVKSVRPANFQMIGSLDAHPRAAPAEAVRRAATMGHVELLGSKAEVQPFIAAADCIVLPSYREGLPRVLLEAAAMAKPAITTDVPGCRDVVVNGVTGLICEPRSIESLTDAMLTFAAIPAKERHAMGRRARSMAEDKFSQERVVDTYVKTTGEIAARTPFRIHLGVVA